MMVQPGGRGLVTVSVRARAKVPSPELLTKELVNDLEPPNRVHTCTFVVLSGSAVWP
jgi:hypothetical protein